MAMEQRDYSIPLRGLPEGDSRHRLECGDDLFGRVEGALCERGRVVADIAAHRLDRVVTLDFRLSGSVEVVCDLCLRPFDYPLTEAGGRVTLELADHFEEVTEELYKVDAREESLDCAQWIYEMAVVSLPIRREHPLDPDGRPTCDPAQLAELDKYLVSEDRPRHAEGGDPRWDALKKLKP